MKGSRATGGGAMGARPHPSLIKGGKPPPPLRRLAPRSPVNRFHI